MAFLTGFPRFSPDFLRAASNPQRAPHPRGRPPRGGPADARPRARDTTHRPPCSLNGSPLTAPGPCEPSAAAARGGESPRGRLPASDPRVTLPKLNGQDATVPTVRRQLHEDPRLGGRIGARFSEEAVQTRGPAASSLVTFIS